MATIKQGVWFEAREDVENALSTIETSGDHTTFDGPITVPTDAATNWRTKADGTLQLKNITDGLYHDIYVQDKSGSAALQVALVGEV